MIYNIYNTNLLNLQNPPLTANALNNLIYAIDVLENGIKSENPLPAHIKNPRFVVRYY